MISAPVGWQCESCVRGHAAATGMAVKRPYVTMVLVGLCAVAFVLGSIEGFIDSTYISSGFGRWPAGPIYLNLFAIHGPSVAHGMYWQIITSGFIHLGVMHILFNGWMVWLLGTELEPRWGHLRYLGLYLAALCGGSLGAVTLSPSGATAGASGAAFGLMAGAFIASRMGGRNPVRVQVGGLIVVNLIFTFVVPSISIGGHIGGLVAGGLAALVYEFGTDRLRMPAWATGVVVATLALVLFAATIAVASFGFA